MQEVVWSQRFFPGIGSQVSIQSVLQRLLHVGPPPGPSSHSSPNAHWTTPSPQDSFLHVEEQPSPSIRLPSSHCSPFSTTPLPQTASILQSAEQPSPSLLFPSSHSS